MGATNHALKDLLAEVGPVVSAHAGEGERAGRLALPVVDAFRRAGIFRMLTPESLGGGEVEPLLWYDLLEEVGRLDGSAAWCLWIAGGGDALCRFLSDEAAEEVWADPGTVVSGSIFPPGKATQVEGGYSLSGHWTFASGCQHADWLIAFSQQIVGGETKLNPAGLPELGFAAVPARDVQIVPNWDVSGLRGTGSHDFTLNDVFVPQARFAVQRPDLFGKHYGGPAYRFPFHGLFASPIGSLALGIAGSAIDSVREMAAAKKPRGSELTLRERPLFQYQLADAVATSSSARSWLREEVLRTWAYAQGGQPTPLEQRNLLALAASHAVRSAAAATDIAYLAGGASAIRSNSPLQRALRDIRAVTQHTVTNPQSIEHAGRVLAGLEPQAPLLML